MTVVSSVPVARTTAGQVREGDHWIPGDWLAVIFNPSFPYRFCHMVIASGLTASFVIAGLSAWRLLRAPLDRGAARTLRGAPTSARCALVESLATQGAGPTIGGSRAAAARSAAPRSRCSW